MGSPSFALSCLGYHGKGCPNLCGSKGGRHATVPAFEPGDGQYSSAFAWRSAFGAAIEMENLNAVGRQVWRP
jgi:hypothetical protein